ncbi:hypothetical protein TTHERM_01434630 (macronuclear) [Tetrahymena thermophila SB210]|uniref:Uncharacterized protein n=1 Tax=Tetrahymena thermophila (strain SB210) TaxID=312017 RepID=Q229D9_TETTS|nr:hypothetical protein TTHERM_01434630 [Tetrahymena thermophila SB210]EAR81903.1 hypothetical protein TTHERM_01434630 [Tetrahymena thermophila SB210]|eukprot:XP_001029566.1 hypothetical protein TTHERM_01434630 [Tetrahymena thermophila SB210]
MEQEYNQFFALSQSLGFSQIYQQNEGYNKVSKLYQNYYNSSSPILQQETSSLNIYDKYDNIYSSISQLELEQDEEQLQENDTNFQQNNQGQLMKKASIMWNPLIQIALYDRMKIMNGLTLTNDGALRMCILQGSTSFNYQQQIVDCIEDRKDLGIVDLHLSQNPFLRQYTIEEILSFLQKVEGIDFYQVEFQLTRFYNFVQTYYLNSSMFNLNHFQLEQKDEELQRHLEFCYNYLDRFYAKNKENSSQMFWYSIARHNYRDHQSEFVRSGFSKSYLELLGLNQSSLSTIYLRKHQVDLIKEKNKITQQTIEVMDNKFKSSTEEKYVILVQTFDGFPLNLIQRKYYIKNEEARKNYLMYNDYSFFLIEFDIDIQELQRLIEYRLKIFQNPNNLSMEEFIQKELSYRFEDVEYSIHSQTFIEKFYKENLEQMINLKEQLIKQQDQKKQCGFKLINQNVINQQHKNTTV